MDPFYELYKDAGQVPIEICVNGILALICFIGITLDWSLVYVTIKSKSLRSPCNILIAIYALSASFLLIGNSVKFFVFLFGINYIPLQTCYYLLFLPLIGAAFATRLQLMIGLERLVAVVWPVWYKQRGKHFFYKLLMGFCCINAVVGSYIFYYAASQHWNKPVMCVFMDISYLPEIASYISTNTLIVYIGEFSCYALIWLIIWSRKSPVTQNNRKLMLSLSIITAISLIAYIGAIVFSYWVMPALNLDKFATEYVVMPILNSAHCFAHGNITIILLICSKEYLSAFRSVFGFEQQQTRVIPIGHPHDNNNTIAMVSAVAPS